MNRMTAANRVDFLRERRALWDIIVTEQQTLKQQMHALHKLTDERSIKPDSPHVSESFIELAQSVTEVCEHLQETESNLQEYTDRLDKVNEMLIEHDEYLNRDRRTGR